MSTRNIIIVRVALDPQAPPTDGNVRRHSEMTAATRMDHDFNQSTCFRHQISSVHGIGGAQNAEAEEPSSSLNEALFYDTFLHHH